MESRVYLIIECLFIAHHCMPESFQIVIHVVYFPPTDTWPGICRGGWAGAIKFRIEKAHVLIILSVGEELQRNSGKNS